MTGRMNHSPTAQTGAANGRTVGYIVRIGQINAITHQKFNIARRPNNCPHLVARLSQSGNQIMTKKPCRTGNEDHKRNIRIVLLLP
jgi:hypothetical protein